MLPDNAAAFDASDACHSPDPRRMVEEGLKRDGDGVAHDAGSIFIDRNSYYIEVFSKQAERRNQRLAFPHTHCYRYEVQNSGNLVIRDVDWRGAFLVGNLAPGPENRRARVVPKAPPPGQRPMELQAFENSRLPLMGWDEMRGTEGNRVPGTPAYKTPASDNLFEYYPDLMNETKREGVALPVMVLQGEQSFGPLAQLVSMYSSPYFKIILESEAHYRAEKLLYEIRDTLTVIPNHGVAATPKVVSPYLAARPRSEGVSDLYRATNEERRMSVGLRMPNNTYTAQRFAMRDQEKPEKPVLFVVEHAVSVHYSDTRECVLMRSYSPLPISFDLRQCPK